MVFWLDFVLTPEQAARRLPEIYDTIALDFDRTRHGAWPELEPIFAKVRRGSKVLDLGCGNGRLIPFLLERKCRVIGVDPSVKLLTIANEQFPEAQFRIGDFAHIPLADESCDEVWAIASFHHLPNEIERRAALQEMRRVLQPNGHLVLSVWNVKKLEKYRDARRRAFWRAVFFPWWHRGDLLIPWGNIQKRRYYYAFDHSELIQLVTSAGFELETDHSSPENLCFRFQKVTV